MARRWNDLSTVQRSAVVMAGVSDVALKAIALTDLRRRPAEQVKGPKWAWLLVILVNSAGLTSMSYLVFGRRKS